MITPEECKEPLRDACRKCMNFHKCVEIYAKEANMDSMEIFERFNSWALDDLSTADIVNKLDDIKDIINDLNTYICEDTNLLEEVLRSRS